MKLKSVGGRGFQRKQMPLYGRKTAGIKREYITANGYHSSVGGMDNMAEF
jgi:hypothetical protein